MIFVEKVMGYNTITPLTGIRVRVSAVGRRIRGIIIRFIVCSAVGRRIRGIIIRFLFVQRWGEEHGV